MHDSMQLFLRTSVSVLVLAPALVSAQQCTGLCLQQVTCANPAVTTTVSGTVYAPNGVDPLPGVMVYVPNGPVAPLPAGATCRQGGTPPSSPLVQAVTGIDGKFTLTNMPVGGNIPLIVQSGKWRRQSVIPNVPACTNTPIPAGATRFPRNHTEGDIPRFAVVTSSIDGAECLLRKIGIADTEFSGSSGTGRIQLFTGAGAGGASLPGSASEMQLEASSDTLHGYDTVMFTCQGNAFPQTLAAQQNLVSYANAGGRVMATHYAYTWLYNVAPFSATTTWIPDTHPSPSDQTAYINQSIGDGLELAQWLQYVGATSTSGQIPLQILRHDYDGVIPPSESWITLNDDPNFPNMSVQYTFDTPVGTAPADQCGRVEFVDYHIENLPGTSGLTFPNECPSGAMTPQEKLYEYMVFNVTNNPTAPVMLTVDDARQAARYGHVVDYTVHLINNVATPVNNVTVTSTLSAGFDAAHATCVGSGGATCTTSGPGGLTASATVAPYSVATWVLSLPVLDNTSETTLTLSVATPGVAPASDTDTLVIFRNGYDVANADGTQ